MSEDYPITDVTKKFSPTSRYKNTNIYEGPDGDYKYYYGIWNIPTIDEQPQDIYYTIQAGETRRLDRIAFLYYDNYNLWWVIAAANNIIDPFDELKVGQVIRIPYLPYIFSKVLT